MAAIGAAWFVASVAVSFALGALIGRRSAAVELVTAPGGVDQKPALVRR